MAKRTLSTITIIILFIFSLIWFIFEKKFDAIIAILNALILIITVIWVDKSPNQLTNEHDKRTLLKLIKAFWITSQFDYLRSNYPFIKLKLKLSKSNLDGILNTLSTFPNQTSEITNKNINVIFNECGSSLLILGDAGSGKSTLLVEIANHCIKTCENDLSNPIPIILSLSTWKNSFNSLEEWIIQEINVHYGVPKKIGTSWLNNHELLLLLDDLDNIPEVAKRSCIFALNKFHSLDKLTRIVVSCRTNDYIEIEQKLCIEKSVTILPLSQELIVRFLLERGKKDKAIEKVLYLGLNELLTTPFMLNVLANSYRDLAKNELDKRSSLEDRRAYILDQYIISMIEKKGRKNYPMSLKTIKWLKWLSRKMKHDSISIYRMDAIQPTWLGTTVQKLIYVGLSRGLAWAWFCFMTYFIIFTSSGIVNFTLSYNSPVTLIMIISYIFSILLLGLLGGLVLALIGFCAGTIYGLIKYPFISKEHVAPVDHLLWSWDVVLIEVKVKTKLIFSQIKNPGALNDFPIIYNRFLFNIAKSLSKGLVGVVYKDDNKTKDRFFYSVKNALLASGAGFLYGTAIMTLFYIVELSVRIVLGDLPKYLINSLLPLYLIFGVIYGGIAFFRFGGIAFFKHITLRLILLMKGDIPIIQSHLLNQACNMSIMKKAGGGYVFIHSLMLDHFAQMDYILPKFQ
ncbi:MAG: NACHT domain-containing protein [Anaerolineaceae bacterium]|nr:NACHT domain-containing protein [Anaerolineaceae bacterium]